jgi:hypothetical protein
VPDPRRTADSSLRRQAPIPGVPGQNPVCGRWENGVRRRPVVDSKERVDVTARLLTRRSAEQPSSSHEPFGARRAAGPHRV